MNRTWINNLLEEIDFGTKHYIKTKQRKTQILYFYIHYEILILLLLTYITSTQETHIYIVILTFFFVTIRNYEIFGEGPLILEENLSDLISHTQLVRNLMVSLHLIYNYHCLLCSTAKSHPIILRFKVLFSLYH